MAEYAGLEIRIGGNTTKLTNALKASTKSAAELQRQIRQITRAMQFDPTSLKNVETRIRITGDRMQSLQSKVQITREAMKQLGDTMTGIMDKDGNAKSVRQIADETNNLSLAAKQADERFNKLTGTLAKIYESWNSMSRSEGVEHLVKNMQLTHAEAEQLMNSSTTLKDFIDRLREFQTERANIGYEGGKPLISDADIERAKQFKELDFHNMFKRGLGLDEMIKQASELGVVIEDSAIENVRELQETFKEAQTEKQAFDDALKLEQMGTDVQRLDSEIESLSQTSRKLDDSLNLTRQSEGFQDLETQIRSVDAALKNVDDDIERTEDALKLDPDNIELAVRHMHDLQQKADLSKEKLELLNQEMDMLKANGAEDAAKDHQDLAKWVEESAEAARRANKEYSDQQAHIANLKDEVKTLKQNIDMLNGDATIVEYSDDVVAFKKRTNELEQAMQALEKAEANVANEQQNLSRTKGLFDDATQSAEKHKAELDKLQEEYEQLKVSYANIYDDPNVDFDTKLGMYNRLQELPKQIDEVRASYIQATDDVDRYNKRLNDQADSAKAAEGALERQKGVVDDIKESISELEKSSDVKLFQNPTDEVEKMESKLKEMEGDLDEAKAKGKQLSEAYTAAKNENELAKTSQDLQNVSQDAHDTAAAMKAAEEGLKVDKSSILNPSTIKSIGMTLSATVTPALSALGYKMVDASATVDSAYRDMRKTVNGTEEQFEHLRQAAIDFSRTHVTSADQILQIEAIGGELGVATDSLETFAEVISNIDVATNLDTESAASALGHLSNILQLTEDDYVGFSDALVRLGNNGASTETEIANIAERIGSMGAIVGMSGSDVLAWSSSLASTGQRAEAAATALSKTWSVLETSVAAAGGTIDTSFDAIDAAVQEGGDKLTIFANLAGSTAEDFAEAWSNEPQELYTNLKAQIEGAKDDLQMFADVAHMSADEFAKAWESDPTEAAKAFINGLNDIEASGGSADAVLQSLGITAVRQKQGIEGLMQTIGGLDDNLKMSEDAWNGVSDKWGAAGDAANEASKKAEGFSGQIQIMKNMAQNFLTELGEGAVPWIKQFTGVLSDASAMFSSLSKDTKAFIVGLGGFGVALGPILSFGGTLATTKKEFTEWAQEATSATNLVKIAMKHNIDESALSSMKTMDKVKLVGAELGTSLLKGLAAGAVVLAISTIVAGLMQLYEQYQKHIAATEGLKDAIAGIGEVSKVATESMGETGKSVGQLVEESGNYESRLADLAQTIEDSNRSYGTYAGQMDAYASTIATLGDKADRTQGETDKLSAALQAVNEACGTTYGLDNYGNIIDTETGKIQENTDVIFANIEARKKQALIEYYSDDYTKAVGEQAEAQSRVNDLIAEQKRLLSDEGHAEYIENYTKKVGNAGDAEQAYRNQIEQNRNALSQSRTELTETTTALETLEGKISTAEEEMNKANETIKAAAAAEEEYNKRTETVTADVTGNMKRMSDAVTELGGSDSGFNSIVEGLGAISVSAEELNNVDMSALVTAFTDTGSSMADVVATLEAGGVSLDTWNNALAQAPGAAENMGSVTSAAFQSMYESAGENIDATMTLIAGLDMVQVDDKTFYIGDNGSITDEQGKIYNINSDIQSIPNEVLTTYYANDADALKKAQEVKSKVQEVDKQNATPKADLRDNASQKAKSLQNSLSQLNKTYASPAVGITDYASGVIASIARDMRNIDGMRSTVTITTVKKTEGQQATGGLNSRPVIPEHAAGYIATGPTMTNQGWVGEAGEEAVVNWATGGAVVPLTNRKYMLPIADAIADGMAKRIDLSHGASNISIYVDGSSDPETVANVIADRLQVVLNAG